MTSWIEGQFYGSDHQEMGGIFERHQLLDAFGAAGWACEVASRPLGCPMPAESGRPLSLRAVALHWSSLPQ